MARHHILVGTAAVWIGCALLGACTFDLHAVQEPSVGDASAGSSGVDAAAGSGGTAGSGGVGTGGVGTGGAGGSTPQGGSGGGGTGGTSATGGAGGTGCSPNYCETSQHSTGWFCDGSIRTHCGTQGACNVVVASQDCGAVGCEGGACKDTCGTTCADRCGTYQSCDCGTCGTNMVCTSNACVPDCATLCPGHCESYAGCTCGGCSGTQACTNNVCTECASGATGSQSCAIGNICSGLMSRTCNSSGSWGSWGNCGPDPSAKKYYTDGALHCDNLVCIRITAGPSDSTVNVTITKEDNSNLSYNADVYVSNNFNSMGKWYMCQGMGNTPSYTFAINPVDIGIDLLGNEYGVNANVHSPCGATGVDHLTGYGLIVPCK